MRTFLVDGFVAGTWRLDESTIHLRPFAPLAGADRSGLTDEARRLLEFLLADPAAGTVRIGEPSHRESVGR